MILKAKNVDGGSFIVEGFAKYTEGVVLEKMYGKGVLWELNKTANERYFQGRTFASSKEPPIYLSNAENYLNYGKSGLIMQSLKDLIGEDKLNHVLKTLTSKYSQKQEFEVHTLEFMEALYKVTPAHQHELIDNWIKQIVRYDLSIGDSSYKQLENGMYEISIDLIAKRFLTLESGEEKEIAIDEPIQIGLFEKHPKGLSKKDLPIYLKQHQIQDTATTLRIQVKTIPKFIAVDPFLTRMDRVYSDNLKAL